MLGSHPLTPGFLGESSKFLRVPRMSGPQKALARGWGFLWALLSAWLLPRGGRAMRSLRNRAGRGHAEPPGELGEPLPSPARPGRGGGRSADPTAPTPSGPCLPAPRRRLRSRAQPPGTKLSSAGPRGGQTPALDHHTAAGALCTAALGGSWRGGRAAGAGLGSRLLAQPRDPSRLPLPQARGRSWSRPTAALNRGRDCVVSCCDRSA